MIERVRLTWQMSAYERSTRLLRSLPDVGLSQGCSILQQQDARDWCMQHRTSSDERKIEVDVAATCALHLPVRSSPDTREKIVENVRGRTSCREEGIRLLTSYCTVLMYDALTAAA